MVSSLTAVVCITIFCLTQRNVHAQGGFWISGLRAVPSKLDKTVNKRVLKTDCTALLTTAGLRQDYDSVSLLANIIAFIGTHIIDC